MKECIRDILKEQLSGVDYDPEEVPLLSRNLADRIKDKLKSGHLLLDKLINLHTHPQNQFKSRLFLFPKCYLYLITEMGFDRYKLVVQVVIGEQRGEGVK